MIKFIVAIFFTTFLVPATSLAQNCFQINSILVDACGAPEGENEMVRFTVGTNNLLVSNIINVDWPNNNYLGICQNANTAVTVAQLNATVQACGYILEPNDTLPANSTVFISHKPKYESRF